MADFDGWDVVLLCVAAYVAIVSLVRMMRRRRDQAVVELQREVELERQRAGQHKARERKQSRAQSVDSGAVKTEL